MSKNTENSQKSFFKKTVVYAVYRCVVEWSGAPIANYAEDQGATVIAILRNALGFSLLIVAASIWAGFLLKGHFDDSETESLTRTNSYLAGELSATTNFQHRIETKLDEALAASSYFGSVNTNVEQISLTPADFSTIAEQANEFASSYKKSNGVLPKVSFILFQGSTRSKHLLRQLKDAVQQAGLNFDFDISGMQSPIGQGIIVYTPDIAHPSAQFKFWVNVLKKCGLQTSSAVWMGDIGKENVVIVINDPLYFGE